MNEIKFKENEYVNLYNPASRDFFSVRILNSRANGYKVKVLKTEQEKDFQDFYFNTYGYHRICISNEILQNLGFQKKDFQYKLDYFIVWECLTAKNLTIILNKYPIADFKHLGYAIIKQEQESNFIEDFKHAQENKNTSTLKLFKEKYKLTFMINNLFEELIKINPNKYNYEEFDKLFKQ